MSAANWYGVTILCVAILAVGLLAKHVERTWVAPAPIFALVWASYPFASAFWVIDFEPYVTGLLWIWWSVLALVAGAIFAKTLSPVIAPRHAIPNPAAVRTLRRLCVTLTLLGIGNIAVGMIRAGIGIGDLANFVAIAAYTAANRRDAMSTEVVTPVWQRLFFVALFFGAICGGMLFRLGQRKRDKLAGIGPFAIVSLLFALGGSRQGILYGGALWLAAYLATHVALSDPVSGISTRFLVRFALWSAGVLFVASTASMALRYFTTTARLDWFHLFADPFGYVTAFGIWFDRDGMHWRDLYYGARTFLRPMEFLGIVYERQPSIWVGFSQSNIYTIFRDLIEDFNPIGSTMFLFVFGAISRLAFVRTSTGRLYGAFPTLVFSYAFIITSVTSGFMMYTTPTLALALFVAAFQLMPNLVRER